MDIIAKKHDEIVHTCVHFLILIFFCAATGSFFYNISMDFLNQTAIPVATGVQIPTKKIFPIKINTPSVLSKVLSPILVAGKASGAWFFEGSFPIKIIDENDNVLGQGQATALTDWMTKDLVPFEAKIEFTKSSTKNGTVVLSPDDPSGQGNKGSIKIPVIFSDISNDNQD